MGWKCYPIEMKIGNNGMKPFQPFTKRKMLQLWGKVSYTQITNYLTNPTWLNWCSNGMWCGRGRETWRNKRKANVAFKAILFVHQKVLQWMQRLGYCLNTSKLSSDQGFRQQAKLLFTYIILRASSNVRTLYQRHMTYSCYPAPQGGLLVPSLHNQQARQRLNIGPINDASVLKPNHQLKQ